LTLAPVAAAPDKRSSTTTASPASKNADFLRFLDSLWPDAQAAGVSRKTFDAALAGVMPDPALLRKPARQAEFVTPVWSYLAGAVTEKRIARGRALAAEFAGTLATIERRYGVDRRTLMGIWGLETNFGTHAGGSYVVRSLATLAFARERGDLFRRELIAALLILERGHVSRQAMLGSWAGAMGQPQFMPSSYLAYAVTAEGGAAGDIWNSVPDALASTANFLAQKGWQRGIPWGCEARLPSGFDIALADRRTLRSLQAWQALGVAALCDDLPAEAEAGLFLPAGAEGPAFLISRNFAVIRTYNTSDAYALAVGLLGDRVGGAGPLHHAWPTGLRALTLAEAKEIQRRLVALGYPLDKLDGKIGQDTREAIRRFQIAQGLVPDGYPSEALLARLRKPR